MAVKHWYDRSMKWMVLLHKIMNKSPLSVLFPIGLLFLLLLLKWQLNFPLESLLFFIGGIIGIYLLDIVEELFNIHPSPFRSIFFMLLLNIVTFYLLSSSEEYLAIGICLFVLFELLMMYIQQWRTKQSLDQWYALLFHSIPEFIQQMMLYIVIGSYGLLCVLFIIR